MAAPWTRTAPWLLMPAMLIVLGACGGGGNSPLPVEARYAPTGPAPVARATGTDGRGSPYTVFYPADLATDGHANALVTYGNGSFVRCEDRVSRQAGEHLASWGFVVVCADVPQAGSGEEMWEAVRALQAENARAGSVFHGQLDPSRVGAMGHSQGATGALNAQLRSGGIISSTVVQAFVDPVRHGGPYPRLPEVGGAVFMASGCDDPQTLEQDAYFDELLVPTAKACLVGAGHVEAATRSLGYAVAWFRYTLQGDAFARTAFTVGSAGAPEVQGNPAWSRWRGKGLP